MSIAGLQGKAFTDPDAPLPPGTCDRCGQKWMFNDLNWQYDFRGNNLQNIRLLVCPKCMDCPFEHFRPIIIPPDPVAIIDARPGYMTTQEGPAPAPNYEQTLAQLID